MLALPIFPVSRPTSIFGGGVLNFCVRDGNRWTLITINTNSSEWLLTILYVKGTNPLTSSILALFTALVNTLF